MAMAAYAAANNSAAASSDNLPGRLASSRPKLPHLPFRRMSMPTVPSLDSLPASDLAVSPTSDKKFPAQRPQFSPRKSNRVSRPPSIAGPRQRLSRESVSGEVSSIPLPARPDMRTKRWNIIVEFHLTEQSYLDGLELVYSVGDMGFVCLVSCTLIISLALSCPSYCIA
jgi:hypothetical protein